MVVLSHGDERFGLRDASTPIRTHFQRERQ
jgi:hypothetical protein